MLTAKTTRAHFEKYRDLAVRLHVRFAEKDIRLFGLESLDQLREKFLADRNLNNIPLRIFDGYAASLMAFNRGKGLSLSDGVCLAKHCLIYQVLGAEPVFTD